MKKRRCTKILSGILSALLAVHGFSSVRPDALTHRQMVSNVHMAVAEDAFSISGGTVMTDIEEGTPVIIRGIVTSAESLITELSVGIYTESGEPVLEQIVVPRARTFNIYQLDSSMSFNLLEVGNYSYRITVSNEEYKDYILVDQEFSVTPSDAAEDTLTITDGIVMEDIVMGNCVEIRGTVHSGKTRITELTVGVFDTEGALVTGKTVHPDDWYYKLNALDAEVAFDLLSAGEYYYSVTASNAAYQDFVLVNQSFSVLSDVPAASETTDETTSVSTTFVTTAVTVTDTTAATTETSAETTETTAVTETSVETTEMTETTTVTESGTATETADYQYRSISAKGVTLIPTLTEGSSIALQGTVGCSKAEIDVLTALVYDASGKTVLSQNVYPAAQNYDLSRLSLRFDTLKAGNYSFKVFVSVQESGALPIIHQTFEVSTGSAPIVPEDTLTLTGGTVVMDIVKGTPVLVSGVINSAVSNITGVTVGIYDMDGNMVIGQTAAPDARDYDVRALDAGICFDQLDAGVYEYRVTAGNALVTDEILGSRCFSVLESAAPAEPDALTITGNPPVLHMLLGEASGITGVVQSADSAITELTVSIYHMSGELVCEQTVHPDAKTFDLNQLDSTALLGTLMPAVYDYRVTANNASYTDRILVNQRFSVSAMCR